MLHSTTTRTRTTADEQKKKSERSEKKAGTHRRGSYRPLACGVVWRGMGWW